MENRKKIGLGLIAGLTSLSVLIGSVFDSSKDLLDDVQINPESVTETLIDLSENTVETKGIRQKIREKIRNLIYKIPVRIRIFVFFPLWLLGNLILAGSELLYKTLLAPAGSLIFGFIFQTLLLLGIIGVCIKIMFPDLPWSKIFSKKLVLLVIAGSVFISAFDFLMPMIWKKYALYRRLSKAICGLIVIAIILRPFIRKKLKNRIRYEARYNGKTFELN